MPTKEYIRTGDKIKTILDATKEWLLDIDKDELRDLEEMSGLLAKTLENLVFILQNQNIKVWKKEEIEKLESPLFQEIHAACGRFGEELGRMLIDSSEDDNEPPKNIPPKN